MLKRWLEQASRLGMMETLLDCWPVWGHPAHGLINIIFHLTLWGLSCLIQSYCAGQPAASQLLARCWSNTQYQVLTVFSLSPHLPSTTHPDPRHFISWQRGKMTIGDPISAKSLEKKYYQFISDFLKAAFEKFCCQYLSLQVQCRCRVPCPLPTLRVISNIIQNWTMLC